mgnify:FL=1
MKTEIRKAVFFGKTVYSVYFENEMDAGLVGNYPTLAAAKKAAKSLKSA